MNAEEIPDLTDPESTDTPPAEGKHRPRRLLRSPRMWIAAGISFVVLVGVGVGSFYLFSPKQTTTAGRTITATATLGTQTASVALDGTLSPRKQADLSFQVSGEVTHVYVKAGDSVTKGQKLATIDDTSLQDAVDLASANLSAAEANYSDVSSSGSSAAKRSAAAQVDSASASLASAKQDLKNATLRATFAGTIASVDIATGDQVSGSSGSSGSSGGGQSGVITTSSSSSNGITLISASTWKLEGTVGAADLAGLKAGQAATVTIDSTETTGTVASVGIVATSTSDGAATFPVVINLSGTHTDLYSGTTASAVITTGTYDNVLTVPTAAITSQSGKTVVSKVGSDNSVTVTEVEVGRVFGIATEITSGLSEGDTVQITFRQSSSSSTNSDNSGGGFGGLGGLGGGLGGGMDGGGGAPPAGAPGGAGAGR